MEVAAKRGTAVHRFLQLAPHLGVEETLKHIDPTHHNLCRKIPKHKIAQTYTPLHQTEIAFAHNAKNGRCRVLNAENREYDLECEEETPGTADAVVAGFLTLEVHDTKTGKTPVAPPSENTQLKHLALCASRTLAPRAEAIVVGIQTVKELKTKTDVDIKWAQVAPWDLDEHERQVMRAVPIAREARAAVAAGKDPPVKPGKWCLFCDAKPSCPAFRNR